MGAVRHAARACAQHRALRTHPARGRRGSASSTPPSAPDRFTPRSLRLFRPKTIEAATGIELDPFFAEAAAALWGKTGLHIVQGDFTKQKPPAQRFNLVLTNPPYVRHHHLIRRKRTA